MTLEQQIISLSLLIMSSYVIGTSFDGYRVLKGKIDLHKIAVFFIDVLFGIIAAVISFYLLLKSNDGQLRITYFFVFFIGLWLYYLTISPFMIKVWLYIFNFFISLWRTMLKLFNMLIITPIKLLYQAVVWIITLLATIVVSIGLFLKKIMMFLFGGLITRARSTGKKVAPKLKLNKKAGILQKVKKLFRGKKGK